MSHLKIKKSILKEVFESLSKIHTEITLEFCDREILIVTGDESHSIYMKVKIDGSLLQDYSVSECKQLVFDFTRLGRFLNVYPEDSVELEITKNAIYVGEERDFLFYVFSEEGSSRIPEVKVIYACTLEKKNLFPALRELEIFSDFFELTASREDLTLSGEDKVIGRGTVILKISKIDIEFKGIFLLHPLLDILEDARIDRVDFKIFEHSGIGISFGNHGIDFEIYIAERVGEPNE